MILDGQEKACGAQWRGMAMQHSEAIALPLATNDTQEASGVAQRYDLVIKSPYEEAAAPSIHIMEESEKPFRGSDVIS